MVSLFGLKTIEEIQTEIFLCVYPLFKNENLTVGANMAKTLLKVAMHLKGAGAYTMFIDEAKINKKSMVNFETLVLCFDDLERMSSSLKIGEFIGYVNSLVDNENTKVVVITNEDKIEGADYAALKEKVIGTSIEFLPNMEASFVGIVRSKYQAFKLYRDFLISNKEFILNVFQRKTRNFRILIFALNYFQKIHSAIIKEFVNESVLSEKQEEILKYLLKFTIVVAIEYKEGRLSYKDGANPIQNKGVDYDDILSNQDVLKNVNSPKGNEALSKLLSTYYSNDRYFYYPSIYKYLTGGAIFIYSDLCNELKDKYNIKGATIPEHYLIYQQLDYRSCFLLTDRNYLKLTKRLLNFAAKGVFDLKDYPTIFHYVLRFNNPLNFGVNKLESILLKGIIKAKAYSNYEPQLYFFLNIPKDEQYQEQLNRIKDAILAVNEEIKTASKFAQSKTYQTLCLQNFELFYKELTDNKLSVFFEPIFAQFDANKFYSFFYHGDPVTKWNIQRMFSIRYNNPHKALEPEIEFLQKFKSRIEKRMNRLKLKNVEGYICTAINECLEKAIKDISEAKF